METGFDCAGSKDAPALLLLHGSVVTRKMWLPQLRGLSDAFYVIAPDLPGHGTLAHVRFSFDACVNTLAALIREQAPAGALVGGLSLGGYVAIELAARQPELVRGLVLSGCTLNFLGATGAYIKMLSGLMRRGWFKMSRAQAKAKTRSMFPASMTDVAEAQLASGVYPEALGPAFAELAGKDFTLSLAKYPGPVLILNGERDKSPRAGETKFASVLRQGQVRTIPDAGHACNIDQPELFNQAVREFGSSIIG